MSKRHDKDRTKSDDASVTDGADINVGDDVDDADDDPLDNAAGRTDADVDDAGINDVSIAIHANPREEVEEYSNENPVLQSTVSAERILPTEGVKSVSHEKVNLESKETSESPEIDISNGATPTLNDVSNINNTDGATSTSLDQRANASINNTYGTHSNPADATFPFPPADEADGNASCGPLPIATDSADDASMNGTCGAGHDTRGADDDSSRGADHLLSSEETSLMEGAYSASSSAGFDADSDLHSSEVTCLTPFPFDNVRDSSGETFLLAASKALTDQHAMGVRPKMHGVHLSSDPRPNSADGRPNSPAVEGFYSLDVPVPNSANRDGNDSHSSDDDDVDEADFLTGFDSPDARSRDYAFKMPNESASSKEAAAKSYRNSSKDAWRYSDSLSLREDVVREDGRSSMRAADRWDAADDDGNDDGQRDEPLNRRFRFRQETDLHTTEGLNALDEAARRDSTADALAPVEVATTTLPTPQPVVYMVPTRRMARETLFPVQTPGNIPSPNVIPASNPNEGRRRVIALSAAISSALFGIYAKNAKIQSLPSPSGQFGFHSPRRPQQQQQQQQQQQHHHHHHHHLSQQQHQLQHHLQHPRLPALVEADEASSTLSSRSSSERLQQPSCGVDGRLAQDATAAAAAAMEAETAAPTREEEEAAATSTRRGKNAETTEAAKETVKTSDAARL